MNNDVVKYDLLITQLITLHTRIIEEQPIAYTEDWQLCFALLKKVIASNEMILQRASFIQREKSL